PSPRASPSAGHCLVLFAAFRICRRSEPLLLVDLFVTVGRCPGRSARRCRCSVAPARASRRAATMTARPLTLPPWQRLVAGILGAAVVSLAFFPIYLGGTVSTGLLDHRLHLYSTWELDLPFWPAMIVPYLSMFVLFLTPPLQL